MLCNSFSEESFPNVQTKPLAQLKAISTHLVSCYLEEEIDFHLATTSFQGDVESNKVSFDPSFLEGKQPRFLQLLLVRDLF